MFDKSHAACGRIVLGSKSPHVIYPRIPTRKDYAHEVHTLGRYLAMTLSFLNFDLVPGAFGEFDGVFRSQHSWFT